MTHKGEIDQYFAHLKRFCCISKLNYRKLKQKCFKTIIYQLGCSLLYSQFTRLNQGASKQKSAIKIQSLFRGFLLRKQVKIQLVSKKVIGMKICKGSSCTSYGLSQCRVTEIQKILTPNASYMRIIVIGGQSNVKVFGNKKGQRPIDPEALAQSIEDETLIVNAAYFVHKRGLLNDNEEELTNIGAPVGQNILRTDYIQICHIWNKYFAKLLINHQIAISCGPMLQKMDALQDKQFNENTIFQYRIDGRQNLLNKRPGALTHCGDPNERVAILIQNKDLIVHTLTSRGNRTTGVTMLQWKQIVFATSSNTSSKCINLDGGSSLFLAIKTKSKLKILAKGGGSQEVRPLSNMIAIKSQSSKGYGQIQIV